MVSFNSDNNSPFMKEMHYLGLFITMARMLVLPSSTQKWKMLLGLSQRAHKQAKRWAHWCQHTLVPGPGKLPQPFSPSFVSTFLPICLFVFICELTSSAPQ